MTKLAVVVKVYLYLAILLVNWLWLIFPSIVNFQAGFQRNRSCDDHLLIVRRILEEYSRAGIGGGARHPTGLPIAAPRGCC